MKRKGAKFYLTTESQEDVEVLVYFDGRNRSWRGGFYQGERLVRKIDGTLQIQTVFLII